MPPPTEDVIRARVVAHMNKDHQPELALYLRAWAGLSAAQASRSTLEDLKLDDMAIRTQDGALHHVRISPAMVSLSDARQTMVRLDREAREKLGVGDVTVAEFRPAKGMDAAVGGAVAFYYFCFFSLGKVVDSGDDEAVWGSVRRFWDMVFPGGIVGYAWVVRTIFWLVVAIHATECALLDGTRLRKYGVRMGSGIWWMWMGTCFFEGYPSFKRFDRVVREIREREGKSK